MTATTVQRHHRPTLPLISMLVAGAAATISVVAITTDDVGPRPATAIVTPQRDSQQPSAQELRTGAAGDCRARALTVRC
jgi:hypothetical protein